MKTVRTKFTGTNTETLAYIESQAINRGFNPFSRERISEVWPKYTDLGVDVYEDWFYRMVNDRKEVLHLVTENDYDKVKSDQFNRLLVGNND